MTPGQIVSMFCGSPRSMFSQFSPPYCAVRALNHSWYSPISFILSSASSSRASRLRKQTPPLSAPQGPPDHPRHRARHLPQTPCTAQ